MQRSRKRSLQPKRNLPERLHSSFPLPGSLAEHRHSRWHAKAVSISCGKNVAMWPPALLIGIQTQSALTARAGVRPGRLDHTFGLQMTLLSKPPPWRSQTDWHPCSANRPTGEAFLRLSLLRGNAQHDALG